MDNVIRFAGISGSFNTGSFNTRLLNNIPGPLPPGIIFGILNIADIPLCDAGLDRPSAKGRALPVQKFHDKLAKARGLVIVSPEYNFSIPGGLENAIDRASRGEDSPLLDKPVAIMGATTDMWGTVRMQLAFQSVFQYWNGL